jgi:hypothetical protein
MTTVVHGKGATWATAHPELLLVITLAVALVAALTLVLLVRADENPATGSVVPAGNVEPACVDDLPMTGAFC